jgi:putative MATE family efflux protein
MESEIQHLHSKKHFYSKVLRIGLPMAFAQLMTSLLSLIDTFMVSGLGDTAVAAVGVSVSFMFLLIMMEFGFFSGLSIFFAQYWGSKDIKNIHKVFIIAAFIGTILTSLFFVLGFFFTDTVISVFNNSGDAENKAILLSYGRSYLKIASFSYFTMSITFLIGMLMRSVERVVYPQLVNIFAVLLNTLLNYLLIHGNLGFPELGVQGAAIATLISSFIGMTLLVGYVLISKEEVFKIRFRLYKDITKEFVHKIFRKALPVAINETIWGLGMTFYLIAYGFISTSSIASIHITNQVMGLVWAVNAGISGASAIMLGNKLGENQLDLAKKWGNWFMKLIFVAGLVFGVSLFIASDYIASVFDESTDVAKDVSMILKVFAFYVPIKFNNAYHIIGSLRSGGDTKYALFAEVGPLWLVGVPLAFILAINTELPLYVIVAIVNIEEIMKLLLLIPRFFTYKWVKNLT